jgi:hypothetical protein
MLCRSVPTFPSKAFGKQEVLGGICRTYLLPLQHIQWLQPPKHGAHHATMHNHIEELKVEVGD